MTETIGGDFGVVVVYERQEAAVRFRAVRIEGYANDERRTPFYYRKGSTAIDDMTPDAERAEPYLIGSVKWNGSTHLNVGRKGALHLFGKKDVALLQMVVQSIHRRCGEMLKASGQQIEESAFE